ncbi:PIN domain-like protein [Dendrothele bispora CBS 962.96]|uniref:PIN domain-like protein n=1 Tax=Dendrothele bispora (strain CBS 962.96) TaxID=1314807 RepID=A0A4S8L8J0_DENBC|nr:PIN domain-like protein [Dendrothele bispora CBS 962.96]
MGVNGLTTFLRENRRALAQTIALPSEDRNPNGIYLVVDGWSFIYELHTKSTLPWVYGGEYRDFGHLVTLVVQAWIRLGFKLTFVFDGPIPPIKFSTLISRSTRSHIEPSLLFFRTSPVSRSTPRFLNESRIIPPLCYTTTIHALRSLGIDLHFADEEGDPYAVELAGRLGAYVVGNDSDFVVLNSEGYMGFVPLDEMVWSAVIPEDNSVVGDDDGGSQWQEYRAPKARKRPPKDPRIGRGIIPPEGSPELTFTFTAYNPNSLATHLNIPVTLLPLLGALVGNDFSNQSASKTVQQLFFERQMTPTARINKVAVTLQSILSRSAQKRKAKYQVEGVVDLIDKTVRTLLVLSIDRMGQGEIEGIVDRVVDATLQYAIPKNEEENGIEIWPTQVCALHKPEECPMLALMSQHLKNGEWQDTGEDNKEMLKKDQVRSLLLNAYRTGNLSPLVTNCLNTATFWPRLFLENPDQETVSRMTRRLRQWCYAILDDAIGLPNFTPDEPDEVDESESEEEESDQDELVDVVELNSEEEESDRDLLAPLRGALQRLHEPNGTGNTHTPDQQSSPVSTLPSAPRLKPTVITEYLRRGTRIADEPVTVPPLLGLLDPAYSEHPNHAHFLLLSSDERLSALLSALETDSPIIRGLSPAQISIALSLRWILRQVDALVLEKGPSKQNMRWTKREVQCLLASFRWGTSMEQSSDIEIVYPPIVDRHVQLVAQILQSIESVQFLAEVMLLSDRVSSPAPLFSGKIFHSLLTGSTALNERYGEVPRSLLDACIVGLEGCLGEEYKRKPKKKNKGKSETNSTPASIKSRTATGIPKRSLFDLLNDVEA